MKILIATGIYPPDIGGPAQYARGVEIAWKKEGHEVNVLAFRFERKLPTGIRHLYYFFRILFSLRGVDFVFSPDTFSAAIPALFACKLLGKKLIVRTGGDFLWEQYVERTGDLVLLRTFYATQLAQLSVKEGIIFRSVRLLLTKADAVIFSTSWQRDIFAKPYTLDMTKCFIVENFYGTHEVTQHSNIRRNVGISEKVFVGGTRPLKWKNISRVSQAFERVRKDGVPVSLQMETGSHGKFLSDIQDCHAVIIASLGDISPNTILDAISLGKPFILTRETGLYERLKDVAVWVNPESVADIAEKIEWLADEKNYTEQCKKVAEFSFTHSYEEIAAEVITIYRNAH